MNNIKIKAGILSVLVLPVITFAETKDLKYIAKLATDYMQIAITLILSLAILMFVYNVYKYFISGSDDVSAKKDAGLYVMWSVIGFFVILSFWGLVNILIKSFNLDSNMPTNTIFGTFRSSGSGSTNSTFNPTTNTRTNLGGASNTGGPTNLGGASNISGPNNLGGASNPGSGPSNNYDSNVDL